MTVTQQQPFVMPPLVYLPPRQQSRSFRFLKWLFIVLGILVVLNLNVFSNRLFGMGQLFSPVILLACLLALIYTKVDRVKGIPIAARVFGGSLIFVTMVGVLSGFANDLGAFKEIAFDIVGDLATPIVFFASALLASSLKKLDPKKADKQVLTIMFVLSFLGVMTIFLPLIIPQFHYFIRGDNRHLYRFAGVYENPNPASMAAITFMIIGLAKTAQTNKLSYLTLAMAVGAAAVLLTGSRSGLISTVFIVLPLGGLVFGIRHIVRIAGSLLILGIIAFVIYSTITQQVDSEMSNQAKRAQGLLNMMNDGLTDENTGGRTLLAKIATKIWLKSPIIGNGIGTSRPMEPYMMVGPHNYYLTVLVETGVLGFVPFLVSWFFVGFKSFDRGNQKFIRILLIGIFLTISFYALTAHTIFTDRNQVFLMGAALGLSQRHKR